MPPSSVQDVINLNAEELQNRKHCHGIKIEERTLQILELRNLDKSE